MAACCHRLSKLPMAEYKPQSWHLTGDHEAAAATPTGLSIHRTPCNEIAAARDLVMELELTR